VVLDAPSFYATFVGGSSGSWAVAPVVAPDGDIIVAGFTSSPDFPTTPGALDRRFVAPVDAFIARLDSTGSHLVYSTFLGGTGSDRAWGIALDSEGSVYVTGDTTSADFPTTPGAFSRTLSGGPSDAFVSKLSPDGGTLQYSTYLGGGGADQGTALTVDPMGFASVVGTTYSADFPIANATDPTLGGTEDAFVTRLDPDGNVLFSTYLGGSGEEFGSENIALDGPSRLYVTGGTGSADFPVTSDAFDASFNGGSDTFIVRLNTADGSIEYATFLGGSGSDGSDSLDVDAHGNVVVAGVTGSEDFPVTDGAFDTTFGGRTTDAFVSALDSGGKLKFSTYLGGGLDEFNVFAAVDAGWGIAVTTNTWSQDFPLTADALKRTPDFDDTTFSILTAGGDRLLFSTYLGGSHADNPHGIAAASGGIVIAGETTSADFPVTPGAFNASFEGDPQFPKAFVARFASFGEPENRPPIADAGLDRVIAVDGRAVLDGSSSSDPDGDPLWFEWVQTRGPTIPIEHATDPVAGFLASAPGEYGFALRVRDLPGGTGLDEVVVTVTSPSAVAIVPYPPLVFAVFVIALLGVPPLIFTAWRARRR